MEQLNRIEIRGTVGSARLATVGGRKVLNCSVATNYVYKDKNGTAVIETTWHNVVAWENDRLPDLTQIGKGTKLYVSGRLQSQRYTGSDEIERFYYEIMANKMQVIDAGEPMQYEMYN
ncbi:MAG: single-stranded DNA-binding protein [Bacteroidales bacterium]|nr:single-stranded DNA-binding protein [Candidatus Cryptobacteroides aphodequi]